MSDTPTTTEPLPGDHLDRLIHSHLDDSLSAEGVRELEGLLRDSAAARARFWELAEVDGLGRDAAQLAWGESPADEVSSGSSKSTSKGNSEDPAGSPSDHDARRRWPHGRWIAAAVAGAVVSSLVAVAFLPGRFMFPIGSGFARGTAQTAPAATPPLATVTNTRFLLADTAATTLSIGQSVAAGEITLLGGAVEVTLRNGVVIVLEGPGELELRDELAAFLHAGSAVVRMPEGMSGFRLDTPTTDVLDLGTEFAVKAAPGFVTDVQVFDGVVVVSSKSVGGNASFRTRLEAGQAARFSPRGAEGPQSILYAESRFIRRLPPDTGLPTTWGNDDEASLAHVYGRPQHDAIVVRSARGPVTIDGRLDDWRLARSSCPASMAPTPAPSGWTAE